MSDIKQRRNRLAPRSKRTYDSSIHGRRESAAPPDDRTISDLAPVALVRPRWNKSGPLIFRPWPALNPERPNEDLDLGRLSVSKLSEWMIRIDCACYIGMPDCPKFTFCLYPPDASDEMKDSNPFRIFVKACYGAHKAGRFGRGAKWDGDWNKLMQGEQGKGAAISWWKPRWFLQGHIYQAYDKKGNPVDLMADRDVPLGLGEKDDLVVVQLSESAGDAIVDLVNRTKDEYEGDADENPNLPFVYGDPVGRYDPEKRVVRGGWIYTVFNPANTKIHENTTWSGKIDPKAREHYEVAVSKEYVSGDRVFKASMGPDAVEQVFAKGQFWLPDPDSGEKGILNFESPREQVLRIVTAFQRVPRLLQFAFDDHEEFLADDDVKRILTARVSAALPPPDGEDDETGQKEAAAPQAARTRRDVTQHDEFAEDGDEDDSPRPAANAGARKVAPARDAGDDEDDDAPPARTKVASRAAEEDEDEEDAGDEGAAEDAAEEEEEEEAEDAAEGDEEEEEGAEDAAEEEEEEAEDAAEGDEEEEGAEDAAEEEEDEDDDAPPRAPTGAAKAKKKKKKVKDDTDEFFEAVLDTDEDARDARKVAGSRAPARPASPTSSQTAAKMKKSQAAVAAAAARSVRRPAPATGVAPPAAKVPPRGGVATRKPRARA